MIASTANSRSNDTFPNLWSYHLYLMKALNLSDKPKEPNHQVYNSNQQQQEYRETDTAENSQYKEQKIEEKLTSQ